MGIKPHKAFFIVIFFVSGLLIGHYLPIWDRILPKFDGDAPTLSEALKDVLGKTKESLKNMTVQQPSESPEKSVDPKPDENTKNIEKPEIFKTAEAQKQGAYRFLDSVVTISKIITAREMKVKRGDEEIYILLEGVEQNFEQFVPTMREHLLGQRLWCKAAIPHSSETQTLVVYAYVLPKSWNESMGSPKLVEEFLLNRIINQQFIKASGK